MLKEVRRPDHLDAFESYFKSKERRSSVAEQRERQFNFTSQPGPMKSNAKQPLNFLFN
jgi:hypothetical protein